MLSVVALFLYVALLKWLRPSRLALPLSVSIMFKMIIPFQASTLWKSECLNYLPSLTLKKSTCALQSLCRNQKWPPMLLVSFRTLTRAMCTIWHSMLALMISVKVDKITFPTLVMKRHKIWAFQTILTRPGACIIKIITATIYSFCNKLECLSLASLSSPA